MPRNTEMAKRIERVLRHLPRLADADPGHVVANEGQLPYWEYGPELMALLDDLLSSGLLVVFDWSAWRHEAERLERDRAALASADLDAIRRLLTFHVRADRFNDGHMAQVLSSGHLIAILRRLEEVWIKVV
jgi:hypothetical protein